MYAILCHTDHTHPPWPTSSPIFPPVLTDTPLFSPYLLFLTIFQVKTVKRNKDV